MRQGYVEAEEEIRLDGGLTRNQDFTTDAGDTEVGAGSDSFAGSLADFAVVPRPFLGDNRLALAYFGQ
jgi:hypothetical protein